MKMEYIENRVYNRKKMEYIIEIEIEIEMKMKMKMKMEYIIEKWSI